MIKHHTNLNSLPRIISFTSSLRHLFNSFLIIISHTHLSPRLSQLSYICQIGRHNLSHFVCHLFRRDLSPISSLVALLLFHLHHDHLEQHNYNQNIASLSTLHFVACYVLNSSTTTHSNLSSSIPLHVTFWSFTSHHPHLCISAPKPTCNDLVPTCKVLFLSVQVNVP